MSLCTTKYGSPYYTTLVPTIDSSLLLRYEPDWSMVGTWVNLAAAVNNGIVYYASQKAMDIKGLFGSDYVFDGTTTYITTGNIPESQMYTLEAWVKTTANSPDTTDGHRIINIFRSASSTKINIALRNNKAYFAAFDNQATPVRQELFGIKILNDGLWHHIVGTTDGILFTLYIDGVVEASLVGTFTTLSINQPDMIGSSLSTAGQGHGHFQGEIGVVRIYNRNLTSIEVNYNYIHSIQYYLSRQAV